MQRNTSSFYHMVVRHHHPKNQNKLSQKCRNIAKHQDASLSACGTHKPPKTPTPKRSPATFAVNHLTTIAVSKAGAIGVHIRADTADLGFGVIEATTCKWLPYKWVTHDWHKRSIRLMASILPWVCICKDVKRMKQRWATRCQKCIKRQLLCTARCALRKTKQARGKPLKLCTLPSLPIMAQLRYLVSFIHT